MTMFALGVASSVAATVPPPFIDFGAEWKYLDDGSDVSAFWRELAYDDHFWRSGPAQLGFGDGDESTVINSGAGADQIITYYFRHTFVVEDAMAFTNLLVRLIRDDGAVVYLNGTEVFRSNMPTGEISHTTLALADVSGSDETTNAYGKTLNPSLLLAGTNLIAVEVHQATNNSGDLSFDLALIGNFIPVPPVVSLTSPTNGARLQTAAVRLEASAQDPDGEVTQVEFYQGNLKLGETASLPYAFTWSDVLPGDYLVTAVASDDHGLAATSAPVAITVIAPPPIPLGAVWRYHADGSDPGNAWMTPTFDDTPWRSGPAQLGFGEGDEATRIGDRTNGFITFYFRHEFVVQDPSAFTNLVVRLLRDDGGIVYLNGTEVFRSNMPEGPVDYQTTALTTAENNNFYATHVNRQLLKPGTNVVAVEIHQVNNTSSDLSFDLELLPNVLPTPPTVSLTSPGSNSTSTAPASVMISASATDFDDPIAAVEFFVGGVRMGQAATEPYNWVVPDLASGHYTLHAVATDTSGLQSTSAPVSITLVSGPASASLISTGAVWNFLDDGSNQDTGWVLPGFNDGNWATGRAWFGMSNSGITTIIFVGPTNGTTNVTTYFRKPFTVTNAALYTNLAFRVVRDDGVVVYLNGADIFRMNMPSGPVNYQTSAFNPVGGNSETNYNLTNISAISLREGNNLLAVELHQYSASTSWDAGFDLGLVATGPPPADPARPALTVKRAGSSLTIYWLPDGFVLQEADAPEGPYRDQVPRVTSGPVMIPATTGRKFYGLRLGP